MGRAIKCRAAHLTLTSCRYCQLELILARLDVSPRQQTPELRGFSDLRSARSAVNFAQVDNTVPNATIEIVDFSEVTDFSLDYAQIHQITKEYQPAKATRGIIATVFCCPSDVAYGIGRMLETLHSSANPNHEVRLVRSQADVEQVVSELRSHK